MNNKNILTVLSLSMSLLPLHAFSQETVKFGLVQGTINVGATSLVTKDVGTLRIGINVQCEESATDLKGKVSDLVATIKKEIEANSEFKIKNESPEVSVSSRLQYAMTYADDDHENLSPYFVDTCNNNAKIKLGQGAVDLTKKTFSGSTK